LPMPYGISSAHSCSLKSIHPSHQAFVRFDGSIEPMLRQEEVKERGNIGYRGKFGIQEFDERPDERTSGWKWLEKRRTSPTYMHASKKSPQTKKRRWSFSDTSFGKRISTTSLSFSVHLEKKPFLPSPHLHFSLCLPPRKLKSSKSRLQPTQSREFKHSQFPSCRTCMNKGLPVALPAFSRIECICIQVRALENWK
jgi:hypothetical protein